MFERHPDIEFDYFLAQKLGMTVAHLRQVMDAREYAEWGMYYRRRAQEMDLARG